MASSREIAVHRQLLLSSVGQFTKKMFAFNNRKTYIVGEHHLKIFDALDKVVRGETTKLIINIAPRYGKTLLVSQMFIAYGLAYNPRAKFIHLSYSASLAQENSIAVKDIVNCDYFQALFQARVKIGSDQQAKWSTIQGGGLYAVSTLGQVTGFGAGLMENDLERTKDENVFGGAIVIDDPIKPEDALSDNVRESVNRRFETTIRNRVNSRNTPIIIIMQRLHEHDLCGYLQEIEPNEWEVLSLPCLTYDSYGNEKALWDFKDTIEDLRKKERNNSFVFETQYQQNPKPLEGFMYNNFRTYEELPIAKGKHKNYTDTADTGSDWLCSVCYIEYDFGLYVTDVLYTKKPMEYTEVETAKMMVANGTKYALIESNNGGRGFARNVEKNVRQLGNSSMTFRTFTQNENKQVRIFSRSADVQNMIYFPMDWEIKWTEFARDIKAFRKEGKNAHDDAPDVLTGMIEKMGAYGDNVSENEILSMFL